MSVSHNLSDIHKNIHHAAQTCDRNGDDITLIAVSKRQPLDRITAALNAGQRIFGENRVQDAMKTWGPLREKHDDITVHLIGPLQSNKAAEAVQTFDVIQTIDRPKIARALHKEMDTQNRHLPCMIQVNTGEEPQKSGVLPADFPALYEICTKELGLNITGLMCIPPQDEAPGLHFALLRKLATRYNLPHLSMGMSHDYTSAIHFGATHIRVGSALFGTRDDD